MGVLDVDLYSSANAFIKNLPDVKARSWRDPGPNAVGSGAITMDLGDAALADCTRKRILKFKDGGTIEFAVVIGPRAQTTIGTQEKASKERTLGGSGVAQLLGGARVFPDSGLLVLQAPQQRALGWPSSDFDDSSWVPAQELYRQDSVLFGYGTLYPAGWRDPTAWWVWSSMIGAHGADPPMQVGTSYFRATLVVPDTGDVRFYTAADDAWKLYLAGELIGQRNDEFGWRDVSPFTKYLQAGSYQVGIEVANVYRPSTATNYAGLLFAAYSTGFGGIDVDLLLHTDDVGSFVCIDYPAAAPGMTPGAAVKAVLDENHFLGILTEITQGAWTETTDENGNAWAAAPNLAINVGSSMLDLLGALSAVCDWWVDPDTLQLRLYNKGGRSSASGITLVEGTHYRDLAHQDAEQPPTHYLVRKTDGSYLLVDGGGSGQVVVGFLEASTAPDDGQADTAVAAVAATPADTLRAAVESRAGAVPNVDYRPGDTFATVDMDGTNRTWTLTALTVANLPADEDGTVGGEALYAIEAHR